MRGLLDDAVRRILEGAVRVATAIGAVLLFLVYWLVLGPVALILRLAGADLLGARGKATTAWTPVENGDSQKRLEGAG
ncbi:MAG: hypothetical protein COV48_16420 [Elusimicrobia bacterium CG11_big_fil_rev_8_21_14_0_20_64_6]|nr:MAG: hypothetical protein COV48_16420 [Elusimicrobia bacterium CG11_big_fil_rev_8_21_14_0_20_64_6]